MIEPAKHSGAGPFASRGAARAPGSGALECFTGDDARGRSAV